MGHDSVIEGGTVVDGTGGPPLTHTYENADHTWDALDLVKAANAEGADIRPPIERAIQRLTQDGARLFGLTDGASCGRVPSPM